MDKRILFVSNGNDIKLKAMMASLTKAGFSVVLSPSSSENIAQLPSLPEIILLYLEDDFISFAETLKYFKTTLAAKADKHALFVCASESEIAAVLELIPRQMVSGTFVRPVNMGDVVCRLNGVASGEQARLKRILVVDDDAIMLRTMKNHLGKKFEVFMANSGMNAISFLAEHDVDLILLDYEMPVASGLQVFEMLRAEPKTAHIPVIFLTGKDDRETVLKVLAAKPEKYLLKTLPPEELVREVEVFFKGM